MAKEKRRPEKRDQEAEAQEESTLAPDPRDLLDERTPCP